MLPRSRVRRAACRRLQPEQKGAIIEGVAANIRMTSYDTADCKGNALLQFELADESGKIRIVGFKEDAVKYYPKLLEGDKYKVVGGIPTTNARTQKLEIKIRNSMDIQCTEKGNAKHQVITVNKMKGAVGETVNVHAILFDVSEERAMRSGEKMRQCQIADDSGDTAPAYLVGAALRDFEQWKDTPACLNGNVSSNGFLFVRDIASIEDEDARQRLNTAWQNPDHEAKKLKTVVTTIADIEAAPAGAKVLFNAIVVSCGISGVPVGKDGDRMKYTMTLADYSDKTVDLAVFCNKGEEAAAFDPGATVRVSASVSTYNVRSLNSKSVTPVEDAALAAWWSANSSTSRVCLSRIPSPPAAVA